MITKTKLIILSIILLIISSLIVTIIIQSNLIIGLKKEITKQELINLSVQSEYKNCINILDNQSNKIKEYEIELKTKKEQYQKEQQNIIDNYTRRLQAIDTTKSECDNTKTMLFNFLQGNTNVQ